jgi:FkbM family methyltransferase
MNMQNDQPFRHLTLKHRAVSWISRHFFDHLTYKVRRGLLKGMRRRGGLGWIPEFGNPLTTEHRFLNSLDLSGKVVFDVGAFQGLLTLFFARKARQVVCYEPNPQNLTKLKENLELNQIQNTTIRNTALGAAVSSAVMVWDPAESGSATFVGSGHATATEARRSALHQEVHITTMDQDILEATLPSPDLIKIDVEGHELAVLQGARTLLGASRPALFLEMHGETMAEKRRNVRAIVEYLMEAGYGSIVHVESGRVITIDNSDLAAQGHLYVTP